MNHVRRERGQLCSKFTDVIGPASGTPVFVPDEPSPLLQAPHERLVAGLRYRIPAAKFIRMPNRRARSGCCARAASGHAAAPPTSPMNPRRFTRRPI